MKTTHLQVMTGSDGLLKLEIPTLPNQAFEVVLIMQPVETEAVDALGWPLGFFEQTYGSFADDPLDRGPELPEPVRDEVE